MNKYSSMYFGAIQRIDAWRNSVEQWMYFALLDELYDEMLRYIEDLGRRIYIYLKQAAPLLS